MSTENMDTNKVTEIDITDLIKEITDGVQLNLKKELEAYDVEIGKAITTLYHMSQTMGIKVAALERVLMNKNLVSGEEILEENEVVIKDYQEAMSGLGVHHSDENASQSLGD